MSDDAPIQIDLRRAIEAFATDERLTHLGRVLARFNIFDAVGPRWKEVDHSACLAFLLSPYETHGLGDAVLRTLLQVVEAATARVGLIPADMTTATVETEVHHIHTDGKPGRIDILVLDGANKLAIIIENKTGSREHDEQLRRYDEEVRRRCGDQWRIVALFLSPAAEPPSHRKWVPVGYRHICEALTEVANERDPERDAGVSVLLDHYADLIRRKLVGDDNIDALCRRLYAQHGAVIDQMIRRVEARRKQARALIEGLVKQSANFVVDDIWNEPVHFRALFIRVAYLPWDDALDHLKGNGQWTKSCRLLLFTFNVFHDHLDMDLQIGPGDARERERLLKMGGHDPLQWADDKETNVGPFSTVYHETILNVDQWLDGGDAELDRDVRAWWEKFTTVTVPAIDHQARAYALGNPA